MSAKELIIKPIASGDARAFIKLRHYSGKVVNNSSLHFGVFWKDKLEGVLQYGASIDKRKTQALVKDSGWNDFLELNRMAFSEKLPKNSESRAIAISIRLIKKHYPHIKWIISYADATQCGDGTIYRASGFILTGVKKNTTMLLMPDGSIVADKTLNDNPGRKSGWWKKNGAKALPGFQIRYMYFIDKDERKKLAVKELPFSKIKEMGAGMYKGLKREHVDGQ